MILLHRPSIFFLFAHEQVTRGQNKNFKLLAYFHFMHIILSWRLFVNRSVKRSSSPDTLSGRPPTPPGTEADQRSSESENHSPPRLDFSLTKQRKKGLFNPKKYR